MNIKSSFLSTRKFNTEIVISNKDFVLFDPTIIFMMFSNFRFTVFNRKEIGESCESIDWLRGAAASI